MKTKLLVFLLLLLAPTFPCLSQDNLVGAFIASPVGKFGSKSLNDGGFAKRGWGIVFDSKSKVKYLPEGMSFYSHSTYQWNEMDSEAIARAFTEVLSPNRVEVSDSRYSPLLTTIGPAYDLNVGKVTFGFAGSIGILFNNTKAFTVKVYDQNNQQIANELVNFDDHVAFAYTIGVDIKFVLIPNLLSLALYSDYTDSNQRTDLSFTTAEPVESFQRLQYLNTGFKISLTKQN